MGKGDGTEVKTLLVIGVLFCVYKIISGLSAKRKEQERERQEEQRQAEAQRMREEWRRTQAEAKLAIQRQEAMWREQERQRKEQERQAKEQARFAKEQERQAAVLEKHEDLIMKMNYRLERAEDQIFHFTSVLEGLVNDREAMQAELNTINEKLSAQDEKREMDARFMELTYASAERYAEVAGNALINSKETEKLMKRKAVLQGKLRTLDNSIFSTEQKIKKAEFDKYEAERKLA